MESFCLKVDIMLSRYATRGQSNFKPEHDALMHYMISTPLYSKQ